MLSWEQQLMSVLFSITFIHSAHCTVGGEELSVDVNYVWFFQENSKSTQTIFSNPKKENWNALQYCTVLDISCSQEQMTHDSNHKSPSLPYSHCNMAFALRAAFPRFAVRLHVLSSESVQSHACSNSASYLSHFDIWSHTGSFISCFRHTELLLQKSSNIKYIFSSGSRPLIISIFRCCIIPKILAIDYIILRLFYANDIIAY